MIFFFHVHEEMHHKYSNRSVKVILVDVHTPAFNRGCQRQCNKPPQNDPSKQQHDGEPIELHHTVCLKNNTFKKKKHQDEFCV